MISGRRVSNRFQSAAKVADAIKLIIFCHLKLKYKWANNEAFHWGTLCKLDAPYECWDWLFKRHHSTHHRSRSLVILLAESSKTKIYWRQSASDKSLDYFRYIILSHCYLDWPAFGCRLRSQDAQLTIELWIVSLTFVDAYPLSGASKTQSLLLKSQKVIIA